MRHSYPAIAMNLSGYYTIKEITYAGKKIRVAREKPSIGASILKKALFWISYEKHNFYPIYAGIHKFLITPQVRTMIKSSMRAGDAVINIHELAAGMQREIIQKSGLK